MPEYIVMEHGDIQFREPMEGDPVLYFLFNPRTRRYQTDVGIIAKDISDEQCIIHGTMRWREQIIFVLTLQGYAKQKRLTNPLAY